MIEQKAGGVSSDGASPPPEPVAPNDCITAVTLNEEAFETFDLAVVHGRQVAIRDLIEDNAIRVSWAGPYSLHITRTETRLILRLSPPDQSHGENLQIPLSRLRHRLVEYRRICEAYLDAIRGSPADKIQTIDMARRGLHNECSEDLREHLEQRATMSFDTARKVFTLVVALFSSSQPV